MGLRGLFEGWHIVILVLVVVVVFGWKRLPDASRSLGRSMRIFKAEVTEMKTDGRPTSAASAETVRGDVVPPVYESSDPTADAARGTTSAQPTYGDAPVRDTASGATAAPQSPQHSA